MPFLIVKSDIVTMKVDAIVNAANSSLLGGGGVDGAIHRAAGSELLEECKTLGGCQTGDAKVTKGYNLPAKFVIHTVGPIWQGGGSNERRLLESCYFKSLKLAESLHVESIAFPLISAGAYGYPFRQAVEVARETIRKFLRYNDMLVYLVIFDKEKFKTGFSLKEKKEDFFWRESTVSDRRFCLKSLNHMYDLDTCFSKNQRVYDELDTIFEKDESFSETLMRLLDKKHMSEVGFYNKANISRKVFSKARRPEYRPSKETACAFGLALELERDDFDKFLNKAGYALSDCLKFDIIIAKCIERKIYDVLKVNEILFEYDQKLLGQ